MFRMLYRILNRAETRGRLFHSGAAIWQAVRSRDRQYQYNSNRSHFAERVHPCPTKVRPRTSKSVNEEGAPRGILGRAKAMRRVVISLLINNESSIGNPRGVNPQSSTSSRRRLRRWWEPVKNGQPARGNARGSRKLCKNDFCHFRLGIVRPIRASPNRSGWRRINNWFVEKKNTILMKVGHIEQCNEEHVQVRFYTDRVQKK